MTELEQFDYILPPELIAQKPLKKRDASKLMVVHLSQNTIIHTTFDKLPLYLSPSDVLVRNNTKVIPARILATKATGANIEIFLLKETSFNTWEAMIKPTKRVKENDSLTCPKKDQTQPPISIKILKKHVTENTHVVQFLSDTPTHELLNDIGHIPLPPYIEDKLKAKASAYANDYQTIYAKKNGAVAAPTAGRHFTNSLIKNLKKMGIRTEDITLHVGMGTFLPIKTNDIHTHKMHEEYIEMSEQTAHKLNHYRKQNQRIIAVGTTVVRTLESVFTNDTYSPANKTTNIFIKPDDTITSCQGLITNFHLPKSTLMCLVAAMTGTNVLLKAYKEAIAHKYRFYSFGDAMLILP